MSNPTPLYYTFGNHMHWVDMQWLWGYHVLPGCVRDMLHFCKETGAKGNVNFDGIGYEKLASENPEAFQLLREAIRSGQVEVVGGSYGQPYGLFHGGESNVRQRIYGVRASLRLFGVRPKTFWEEEFDFFPQLPQMLKGCGFEYSSLFFQWTWHTPEVPKEPVSAIWWEGVDGSRLLCAPRNELNLHQWPEDMQILLDQLSRGESPVSGIDGIPPLIQQWLELMPSPDWMCRSEVLLPKMRELMNDPRFEVHVATLGEYLALHKGKDLPVRRYGMGDVWHGLSLGKNGDDMRLRSARSESRLLNVETLSTIASLLGRPYAQWDVYPVWEFEEAWRELLAAQHHDNDECEGLCGRFGKLQYQRAEQIAENLMGMTIRRLIPRNEKKPGPEEIVDFNLLGWKALDRNYKRTIAPFSVIEALRKRSPVGLSLDHDDATNTITQGDRDVDIEFVYDLTKAGFTSLRRSGGPELAMPEQPAMRLMAGDRFLDSPCTGVTDIDGQYLWLRQEIGEGTITLQLQRSNPHNGVDISFGNDPELLLMLAEPGFKGAICIEVPLSWPNAVIYADSPYAVEQVTKLSSGVRKYPQGDWMTSPQWFETMESAFTSQSFVDIVDPVTGEGLLIASKHCRQWFLHQGSLRCVLALEDPWDEKFYREQFSESWMLENSNRWNFDGEFRLIPHKAIDHAERWKIGQEYRRFQFPGILFAADDALSLVNWSFCDLEPHHVVMTALYRESEDYSSIGLEQYAGTGMGYPFVVRLLELNGEEANVGLTIAGTVAKAFRTNLMGEIECELEVEVMPGTSTPLPPPPPTSSQEEGDALRHPFTGASTKLHFKMRPHEIATLYLDIVEGRKQARDLDAKREVWATVHRLD